MRRPHGRRAQFAAIQNNVTVARADSGNDRVYTIIFEDSANKNIDQLIAITTTGGLDAEVKTITLKNVLASTDPAMGEVRLAIPSTIGVSFFNNLKMPSIFALLSDPGAVVIDGLDRLLLTLQEALNGQIMGAKLPFVGDLLANNPAANFIEDFRDDLLQPLARVIRENSETFDVSSTPAAAAADRAPHRIRRHRREHARQLWEGRGANASELSEP